MTLFITLNDRFVVSQKFYYKAAYMTFANLNLEWYGIIVGRFETKPNLDNPLVLNATIYIDDFLVPKQKVTGGGVQADATAIAEVLTIDVIDKLNKSGHEIVGWVHSHGRLQAFLSGTDMSNIDDDLAMQPVTASFVCSYNTNSEYQPKKTPANNNHQNSKGLDTYLQPNYAQNNREFHMAVYLSVRLPFSEKKAITEDLAANKKFSQLITWPEHRPRQKEELLLLMPLEMQQELDKIRDLKISAPRPRVVVSEVISTPQPRSRPSMWFRKLIEPVKNLVPISGCYSNAIRHILPNISNPFHQSTIPAKLTTSKSQVVARTSMGFDNNWCPFCETDMEHTYTWACENCQELIVAAYNHGYESPEGLDYDEVAEIREILDDEDLISKILLDLLLGGSCDMCPTVAENELLCQMCRLKFYRYNPETLSMDVVKFCEVCGEVLTYKYHFDNEWDQNLGMFLFCNSCQTGFVLNPNGILGQSDEWFEQYQNERREEAGETEIVIWGDLNFDG